MHIISENCTMSHIVRYLTMHLLGTINSSQTLKSHNSSNSEHDNTWETFENTPSTQPSTQTSTAHYATPNP
jgi:hypothetical protein